MSEFECYCHDGQNLQMVMSALQSNSHPRPQGFATPVASFPSSQRCTSFPGYSNTVHVHECPFLNHVCPAEIIWLWKLLGTHRTCQLGNGPYSFHPANHLGTLIDKYYARNQHLLPERLWKQTFGQPARSLLVRAPRRRKLESFAHLESIMRRMRYSACSEGKRVQRRLS